MSPNVACNYAVDRNVGPHISYNVMKSVTQKAHSLCFCQRHSPTVPLADVAINLDDLLSESVFAPPKLLFPLVLVHG